MWACCVLFLCLIAGIFDARLTAADPLSWIPPEVNAVAKVEVAKIYKTPLAQQEGWLKQATDSFVQQHSFVPPGTNEIVIGADLDLSLGLVASRKFSVVVPEEGLTLKKLSNWFPGGLEMISDKPIAQFGDESYVADAGDGCWLVQSGNRQAIYRWLKTKPVPAGSQLPNYLRTAMTSKDIKSPFVLAVDLQENFSAELIAAELTRTDWFKSDVVIQSNARILASIQGVTIAIDVDKERSGKVMIDFGEEAVALNPVLEKLVNTVMERSGIATDDFAGWKWSVNGKRITGTGAISPGGGRRLLSILDPPSLTHAMSPGSAEPPPTAEEKMAKTSLKYFKSIRVLIDEMREVVTKATKNHGVYLDRYARKIDDLPKLSVDPLLLDFAGKVSSSMRYQAQVQRMGNIDMGTKRMQAYGSLGGYVGPYGWYTATINPLALSGMEAQENQNIKSVRYSEWKQIDDGMVTLRRTLTEKYQIEF